MTPKEHNKQFFKSIPYRLRIAYNLRFFLEHFFGFFPFSKALNSWDSRIQEKIYNSIKGIEKQHLSPAEFREDFDPVKIRKDYVRKGIPVIIRGGAKSWKAYQDWDFEFFKDQYGDHPVLLTNHQDLGDDNVTGSIDTNLREIINGIDNNSMHYARFNPLLDSYPELQNQMNQSWLDQVRDTKIKKHHVLFIGNKGTKTNIHNAGNDNIFVQIRGRKRWLLWDQRSYYILNPKVNRAPAKASPIDPNQDNNEENPAFNHLPMYELILEPGDILLIPAFLWHYVENLTPTIGIGNRWLSPHNSIRNNPLFAILELFNTSPTIFATLDWRKGFDFNKIMMKNKMKK